TFLQFRVHERSKSYVYSMRRKPISLFATPCLPEMRLLLFLLKHATITDSIHDVRCINPTSGRLLHEPSSFLSQFNGRFITELSGKVGQSFVVVFFSKSNTEQFCGYIERAIPEVQTLIFYWDLKTNFLNKTEYSHTVKQTFGVPGSPGNHYLVVKNPSLISEERSQNATAADMESTVTVFSLTILVVSVIGIVLLLVISYFCYSFTSSFICYLVQQRDKRHRTKYMEATTDTETSSLESVETE
ncbi:unnamed protein product, partial [Allacma fusca]